MTGDNIVKAGNLLPRVAEEAAIVYRKILDSKCIPFSGVSTFEEIGVERGIDNDSAVSITLQGAGILERGKLISHTRALGEREAFKKKTTVESIVNGTEYLIDGTYKIVLTGCVYKNLPEEYKQAGIVYFYDDSVAISGNRGSIYTLGGSLTFKLFGGYFTKDIATSGKAFTNHILAILVPLDKKLDKIPLNAITSMDELSEEEKELVTGAAESKTDELLVEPEPIVELIPSEKDLSEKELEEFESPVEPLGASSKKSNKTIALEVMAGTWGSGDDRRKKLTKAGYDYDKIQILVEDLAENKAKAVKAMNEWATKIANDNSYHYKIWESGDSKTHECPICKKYPKDKYTSSPSKSIRGHHGWNCIGFAFAVWHHGGNLKSRCNCHVIANEVGEQIASTKTSDAKALSIVKSKVGISNVTVIRNNGKNIPKEQWQAGDICLQFSGNKYVHTFYYRGNKKITDSTGSSGTRAVNEQIATRSYKNYSARVIIRYLGDFSADIDKKVNATTNKTIKKSVDVIAQEVIDGKWGNGDDRKAKLEKEGYNYKEVQNKVNEILSKKKVKSAKIGGSVVPVIIEDDPFWDDFEQSLCDTAEELKKRGVEYSGKGSSAGNIKDVTDSAGYIQESLYNIKSFLKNERFYLSQDLHGTKRGVEYIKKHFDITYPKSVWYEAPLKEGDIVGFDWGDGVNTMVFGGIHIDGESNFPVWYSFGGSTPFDNKPIRKEFYEDKVIYVKLRHKDMK